MKPQAQKRQQTYKTGDNGHRLQRCGGTEHSYTNMYSSRPTTGHNTETQHTSRETLSHS